MAHNEIARQLKEHSINRRYRAIVTGVLKDEEGTIEGAIGRDKKDRKKMAITADGKPAVTHYRVLQRFKHYTYVECVLETGRTHQIRVHMKHLGYPLIGDYLYHPDMTKIDRQALHSSLLEFTHPITKKAMKLSAPLPCDMRKLFPDF